MQKTKLLFVVTDLAFFYSHRLPIAKAAVEKNYDVTVVTNLPSAKNFSQNQINYIHLPFSHAGKNIFTELKHIFLLTKIYHKTKPDIIHHVAMQPIGLGSVAACITKMPRIVNAVTGLGYVFISNSTKAKFLRLFFFKIFRWFFNKNNWRTIVQNSDDLRLLQNAGVKSNHISLIRGSGVDINKFTPSDQYKTKAIPIITFVGRLQEHKGIVELVEAIKLLKKDGIIFEAWLAGDVAKNSLVSIKKETINYWQNQGLIKWLGHRSDIANLWHESTIAVLPSYREGLPKALLEAAACGKAIVATDVPGCREIVINNKNGYLVPVKNAQALADSIRKLITNPSLVESMGKASRKLVEDNFSLEYVVNETIELYAKMLKK
ncbi:MAG: glycosyltransferase family 4 protein [Gammaproteobacteria bacterium]|nr:glycosyltransferase family 4 protein [Gammaproteobacteria bacterium]